MSATDSAPPAPDEPPGVTLARLRKQRGLSGTELAALVGMSQPKISRIERGQAAPDPRDIEKIARALGASHELALDLAQRSAEAQNRITDWRPAPLNLATRQNAVGDWETNAVTVREFTPTIIPGLLQTSGYAKAVLLAFQSLIRTTREQTIDKPVLAAVSARLKRQEMLATPDKRLHFVLTENALRQRVCPPEQLPAEMLAQISHLRTQAARPNVTIAIIADDAITKIPPLHSFMLFDNDLLLVDVYNTGLVSRGAEDIDFYERVFTAFAADATEDIDPILRRYELQYSRELQEGLDRPSRT